MKHFHLIADHVPIAAVNRELAENQWVWNRHTVRKTTPGTPHAAMSDAWIRFQDVVQFESGLRPWSEFGSEHTPIWYREAKAVPSLRPVIYDLMRAVEGDALYGVLITKIPPGGRIERHTDDSFHVRITEKFYLSLQSEPGAKFHCHEEPEETLEPKPGQCWLFDNRKPHSVVNDSKSDRVTAIICIRTAMFGREV